MRNDLLGRAVALATAAHAGQFRKFTGAPYITHPKRVAFAAASFGLSPAAVVAAVLHDVPEDTDITNAQIETEFGARVAGYVWGMTNAKGRGIEGNRSRRKAADREFISRQPDEVRALKMLDMADNMNEHDPTDGFFSQVLRENRALADDIKHGVGADLVAHFETVFERSSALAS